MKTGSNSRPLTLNPSPHRMGRGNLIRNTLSSIGWRRGIKGEEVLRILNSFGLKYADDNRPGRKRQSWLRPWIARVYPSSRF
jgi:hypothetical protein